MICWIFHDHQETEMLILVHPNPGPWEESVFEEYIDLEIEAELEMG